MSRWPLGAPRVEALDCPNVVIGHVVACYGATDRYLGMLATVLGEWGLAEGHFERALDLNRRMGAATWLAHTLHEYGRMLVACGRDADALFSEADALAERIGMPVLRRRLGRRRDPLAEPPDGLSHREVQILMLVAEGRSNREIGTALFISEHTAANHIRSILRKTRCANRTEAASYAHRHQLVGR